MNAKFRVPVPSVHYSYGKGFGAARIREVGGCNSRGRKGGKFRVNEVG